MSSLYDVDQRAVIEAEGARFNEDGRFVSNRYKFYNIEQRVKGTMGEKFIKSCRDEDIRRAEMWRVVIV